MSVEFFLRLIGMVIMTMAMGYWGLQLSVILQSPPDLFSVTFGLVGALAGLILTPYFTTRPVRALRARLRQMPPQALFAALVGLICGLIIAALLSFPLSLLPTPFGQIMPFLGVVLMGYLGVSVFLMRQHDILSLLRSIAGGRSGEAPLASGERTILVDTSVLIDGRILDVARTGFLTGTLLIPRFVLNELQYIADSPDPLRRQRGRRGLDIVNELQRDPTIAVRISDVDVEHIRDVDEKLILLARKLHGPLLTNDYNLNKVAEVQGVPVLNINELANAVKSVLLPGETLELRIIQEGKEVDQGVGYLEDGTMVVVENGRALIGQTVTVEVTKALQTHAGRMIFARPL